MSTVTLQQNAVSQFALQADAVGKLAQDTGAFAAVVAAFESNDPTRLVGFSNVLNCFRNAN